MADEPRIHQRVLYNGIAHTILGFRKGGAEVWICADDQPFAKWVGVGDVEAIEGGGRDG